MLHTLTQVPFYKASFAITTFNKKFVYRHFKKRVGIFCPSIHFKYEFSFVFTGNYLIILYLLLYVDNVVSILIRLIHMYVMQSLLKAL